MKKPLVAAIFLLVGVMMLPLGADADQLIPSLSVGDDATITVHGYTQGLFSYQDGKANGFSLGKFRVRLNLETKTPWSAFVETELVRLGPDADWLKQAYITYDFGGGMKIRAGRLPLAASDTDPPPFVLETVHGPRSDPFGAFGNGLEILKDFGDGVVLRLDAGGRSGVNFQNSANWDTFEFGGRLQKNIGSSFVALSMQLREDSQKFSLDAEYRPTETVFFRGAAYAVRGTREYMSGYVLAGWRVVPWLELHSQIDHPGQNNPVFTNGVRIIAGKGWQELTVTADYEKEIGGHGADGLFIRFQLRF